MNINKALFLDRDGVINRDFGYVFKIENLEILDGIISLCQKAQNLGYKLIVVTNQSGIGRGYYTEEDFWHFMEGISIEFAKFGVKFDAIYFSPYHPESKIKKYQIGEEFRKPNNGMILKAQEDFNLNLEKSVLIGDKITDIQAGISASVGRNVLISQNCLGVLL
jgi:D-glycero-D-manno-heptose 1,7-bisphosphate phosphatase